MPHVLVALSASALAGVTGHVSSEGQAISISSYDRVGGTRQAASLMLEESIGLHYSGMPFGPSVALIAAGVEALNVNSWSSGASLSGRAASIDLSVGLFPRRALPVRIYAHGTLTDGSGPSVLTMGNRESLLYGASLNLDPDQKWPGARLEAQEQRMTALGSKRTLGDVTRMVSGSVYRSFGEHQVNLGAQFRQDEREVLGKIDNFLVNGSWTSPRHQTGLVLGETERTLLPAGLAGVSPSTDRFGRLWHVQRWFPELSTDASAHVVDSSFANGTGTQVGVGVGASWKPLAAHDFLLSGSADVGATRSQNPGGTATGSVGGGGLRAAYSRPVRRFVGGAAFGASATHCSCVGSIEATRSMVDGTLTLGTLDFERFNASAEYTVAWVQAPPVLGGARFEHHARLAGQARIHQVLGQLSLGYDDSVRDYVDVTTNQIVPFHERVFVGAISALVPIASGTLSAEARHARGASFSSPSPFVNAPLSSARTTTHVSLDALYPVGTRVEARAGALADWTTLSGSQGLFTAGGQATISVRFGRLIGALSYQYTRSDVSGLATNQHLVRLMLSRPFAL